MQLFVNWRHSADCEPSNVGTLKLFNVLIWFRPYTVLAVSVFAVVQTAQAVFELPTGMYSDIVGRRRCLILGTIASAISVVWYALATSYSGLLVGALV